MIEELNKRYGSREIKNRTRYHKETYVEGQVDYFLEISLPELREFVRIHQKQITDKEIIELLTHKIHDYRTLALMILESRAKKGNLTRQKEVFDLYLKYLDHVNNWDLVDLSAPSILGRYVYNQKDYSLLYELVKTENLWHKRIGIVASLYLIKQNEVKTTLELVDILIVETHDLLQKACGWMLREVGKINQNALDCYLKENYQIMPRTMLRYAIEKYPEEIRSQILKGEFLWQQK